MFKSDSFDVAISLDIVRKHTLAVIPAEGRLADNLQILKLTLSFDSVDSTLTITFNNLKQNLHGCTLSFREVQLRLQHNKPYRAPSRIRGVLSTEINLADFVHS